MLGSAGDRWPEAIDRTSDVGMDVWSFDGNRSFELDQRPLHCIRKGNFTLEAGVNGWHIDAVCVCGVVVALLA